MATTVYLIEAPKALITAHSSAKTRCQTGGFVTQMIFSLLPDSNLRESNYGFYRGNTEDSLHINFHYEKHC